jgi:hypothetical protein
VVRVALLLPALADILKMRQRQRCRAGLHNKMLFSALA